MSLAILDLSYEVIGFASLCRIIDNNGNIYLANVLTDIGRKVYNPYNKKEPYVFYKDIPTKLEIVGNPLIVKKNKDLNLVNFKIEKRTSEKHIELPNHVILSKRIKKHGKDKFTVDIDSSWEQYNNGFFYKSISNNQKDNGLRFRNNLPAFPWQNSTKNEFKYCFGDYCEDNTLCIAKEGKHVLKRFKFDSKEQLKAIKAKHKGIKSITIKYSTIAGVFYLIDIK